MVQTNKHKRTQLQKFRNSPDFDTVFLDSLGMSVTSDVDTVFLDSLGMSVTSDVDTVFLDSLGMSVTSDVDIVPDVVVASDTAFKQNRECTTIPEIETPMRCSTVSIICVLDIRVSIFFFFIIHLLATISLNDMPTMIVHCIFLHHRLCDKM